MPPEGYKFALTYTEKSTYCSRFSHVRQDNVLKFPRKCAQSVPLFALCKISAYAKMLKIHFQQNKSNFGPNKKNLVTACSILVNILFSSHLLLFHIFTHIFTQNPRTIEILLPYNTVVKSIGYIHWEREGSLKQQTKTHKDKRHRKSYSLELETIWKILSYV